MNVRTKLSDRKLLISGFQSQFSMAKIDWIFLNFFFIEKYQFRDMFFVIDIFWKLELLKHFALRPVGCWKHLFGTPGVRPMFLKPKFHKESKNGFKAITYRCYPVMIFSKNCFRRKKNHYWVAPVIDCFEPIFGFLMQFWF